MSSPPDSKEENGQSTPPDLEEATLERDMARVALDSDKFSLDVLIRKFDECVKVPGLCVDSYVQGYREVYKFLNLLGTLFGWVGSDVWHKIAQLQKYLDGDNKDKYQNIKAMIDYEVENDLIKTKKKDDPSGTRTLLRLHRALEYIISFLHKLEDIDDSGYCSVISVEAYETTLMKYHPWVVQKAAKIAMKLLPTKGGLTLKVHPEGSEEGIKKVREDFPKAVTAMRAAYDAMQDFYRDNNLLDIP